MLIHSFIHLPSSVGSPLFRRAQPLVAEIASGSWRLLSRSRCPSCRPTNSVKTLKGLRSLQRWNLTVPRIALFFGGRKVRSLNGRMQVPYLPEDTTTTASATTTVSFALFNCPYYQTSRQDGPDSHGRTSKEYPSGIARVRYIMGQMPFFSPYQKYQRNYQSAASSSFFCLRAE